MPRSTAKFSIVLVLAACGAGEEAAPVPELTTLSWAPTPAPEDLPYAPSEPLDPRLVTMSPQRHLDQERLCDLAFAGRLRTVGPRHLGRYPVPVSHRVTVGCRAQTGQGWADLVFPKDTAGLAPFVDGGERIRVRVIAVDGFEGHPVLAFVANIGPAPAAPPRWLSASVRTGDVFPEVWTGTRACSVVHAHGIERIESDDVYPDDASHHSVVTCRHAAGERGVDMAFPERLQRAALRLVRGEVVPVEFHGSHGQAGFPIGVYAGP